MFNSFPLKQSTNELRTNYMKNCNEMS